MHICQVPGIYKMLLKLEGKEISHRPRKETGEEHRRLIANEFIAWSKYVYV